MKVLGSVLAGVLLLLVRDGLNLPTSADPFETTASVGEGCPRPKTAGRYRPIFHQILICTPVIEAKARSLGVSAAALKRFILAHEAAHSRGAMNEMDADRIAADRLFNAGDIEALKAYGAIPSNGTAYDKGRRYAHDKAQQQQGN